MNEIKLGLCDEPVRRFLYISQDESGSGSCWYSLDHSRNPPVKIPIPQRGVKGYITGIRVANVKTAKHGVKAKLDIFIDAGEESFAIRSGVETTFARGIIQSLLVIEEADLARVLTIVAAPSKENTKIVFGAVYIGAQRVKFVWDKTLNLHDPIRVLQAIFGNGGEELADEHGDDDVPDQEQPWNQGSGEDDHQPTSRPAGLASTAAIKELERVGRLQGLVDGEDCSKLNDECARLYAGKVTAELTVGEAIEFRKTLIGRQPA